MTSDVNFSKEEIRDFLKENYNVDASSIEEIDRGTALLYNINEDKYALKIFQDKYSKEDILKEVNIINVLYNDKIPVPKYIRSVNDELYSIFKGKTVILQEFIKGTEIDPNTGDVDMLIDSAQTLGKIVKSLNSTDLDIPKSDIESWYSDECIQDSLNRHEDLLKLAKEQNAKSIIEEFNFKIDLLKKVKSLYNFDDLSNLTLLNTHGDFNVLQCIYGKDMKIKAVLDFVAACKMPITWEIIRSYSYLDKDSKDGSINVEHFKKYVSEFMKYQKLNKYDIKYMCLLYFVQILTSTFGYKQYLKDNSRVDLLKFAEFRTNLCKYLYKNMDLITNSLLELID